MFIVDYNFQTVRDKQAGHEQQALGLRQVQSIDRVLRRKQDDRLSGNPWLSRLELIPVNKSFVLQFR